MSKLFYGIFDGICRLFANTQTDKALSPIYKALSTIGPYAMGVILSCGLIYGIVLGVKFAKTENSEDRAKLQKALINGIIGFIAVFTLITILYAIREPLSEWMAS